jgi:uncharacterized membrane protein
MNLVTLTIAVYVALTTACGVSLWMFLAARRDLRRIRKTGELAAEQLHAAVAELSNAGFDAAAISRKLDAPLGDVRLALEIDRLQRTTTFAAA